MRRAATLGISSASAASTARTTASTVAPMSFIGRHASSAALSTSLPATTATKPASSAASSKSALAPPPPSSKQAPTLLLAPPPQRGRGPGPTVDRNTGHEVQRFVVAPGPNVLIEPVGGSTVSAGKGGQDTHTLYPNQSNYQRLNPQGHGADKTPHGHGHAQGKGPGKSGQGPSLDVKGKQVSNKSPAAHWKTNP